MPGTFSQLLVHIVFATKQRHPWITTNIGPRLHAYLGGIVREEGGIALEVNGAPDHGLRGCAIRDAPNCRRGVLEVTTPL